MTHPNQVRKSMDGLVHARDAVMLLTNTIPATQYVYYRRLPMDLRAAASRQKRNFNGSRVAMPCFTHANFTQAACVFGVEQKRAVEWRQALFGPEQQQLTLQAFDLLDAKQRRDIWARLVRLHPELLFLAESNESPQPEAPPESAGASSAPARASSHRGKRKGSERKHTPKKKAMTTEERQLEEYNKEVEDLFGAEVGPPSDDWSD